MVTVFDGRPEFDTAAIRLSAVGNEVPDLAHGIMRQGVVVEGIVLEVVEDMLNRYVHHMREAPTTVTTGQLIQEVDRCYEYKTNLILFPCRSNAMVLACQQSFELLHELVVR